MESLQIQYDAIENSCFLHELIQDVNVMDELESQMMLYWAGQESAAEFARRMIIILSKP